MVLKGSPHRGVLRDEMVRGMQEVAALLRLQGVRLSAAFERDLPELRDSIAFLERSDLVASRLDHRGEILHYDESRRRALDIYRNAVAHFLVIPSIVARATLAGLEHDRVHQELEVWTDLFYREYYASRELYLTRGEAVLEHFESEGWVALDDGVWRATEAGTRILGVLAEQTRGVIECYDAIVRVLLGWMESAEEGVLHSGLVKEAELGFEGAQLLGLVRRSEALSPTSQDNLLAWLVDRDILVSESIRTGKRNARDTRYARGEKWMELEQTAAILAAALRDR